MNNSYNKRNRSHTLSPQVAKNVEIAREETTRMVYCLAMSEGLTLSYQKIVDIVNHGIANGVSPSAFQKIKNIECAWKYIYSQEALSCPASFNILLRIIKTINKGFYAKNERIRCAPLLIEGTTYVSPIPEKEEIKWDIQTIVSKRKSPAETAIDLCFYCMKTQIFNSGNKQIALLLANHFLISQGGGLIMVAENEQEEFNRLLIMYYEGMDENEIKRIMKNKFFNSFGLDSDIESESIIEKVRNKLGHFGELSKGPNNKKNEKRIADEKAELFWLLSLNYYEIVSYLLSKYGSAAEDYFLDEKCTIVNRSVFRTGEGLFCHHIDEDKAIYLSSQSCASRNPFEYQRKDHLVYCNLLEHLILHVKIVEGPRNPNANTKELLGIVGAELICIDLNDIYVGIGTNHKWPTIVGDRVIDHFDVYISILKHLLSVVENNPEYHGSTCIRNLSVDGSNRIVSRVWDNLNKESIF